MNTDYVLVESGGVSKRLILTKKRERSNYFVRKFKQVP
jgi:hypothetical protein